MKNKLISTLVGFAHQVPSCLRVLRVCSVWLLLSLFVSAKAAEKSGNVAYMDSHVRITVLSDGVVRLEYVPDGHFVDEASFICVNRNYPEVEYKTVSKKTGLRFLLLRCQSFIKKIAENLRKRIFV